MPKDEKEDQSSDTESCCNDNNFPYLNMIPDRPNPPLGTSLMMDRRTFASSKEIIFSSDGLTIRNNKDYCISLANHGITEGTYYFEVRILDLPDNSNIRLGISQVSSAKEVPLGYDGFSYSFRSSPGTLFHRSRPFDVDKGYYEGDVVGVLLHLPELDEKQKKEVEFRLLDHIYGSRQYSYEQKKYFPSVLNPVNVKCGTKGEFMNAPKPFPPLLSYSFTDPFLKFDQLPLHPGSQLSFFVNGEQIDISFINLILGKHHPAVSLYNGARVKMNFGPQFDYPPPTEYNPLSCKNTNTLDLKEFGFFPKAQKVLPFSALTITIEDDNNNLNS